MPEPCAWYIMVHMLAITADMQDRGVSQSDEHGGNWFLHFESEDDELPQLPLDDLDFAKVKADEPPDQWRNALDGSMPRVKEALLSLMTPGYDTSFPEESELLPKDAEAAYSEALIGRDSVLDEDCVSHFSSGSDSAVLIQWISETASTMIRLQYYTAASFSLTSRRLV